MTVCRSQLRMSSYSVTYARAHLSGLIRQAHEGETVVITRRGRPVVEITPVARAGRPVTKA
jgi:prevent-host-death family protein